MRFTSLAAGANDKFIYRRVAGYDEKKNSFDSRVLSHIFYNSLAILYVRTIFIFSPFLTPK